MKNDWLFLLLHNPTTHPYRLLLPKLHRKSSLFSLHTRGLPPVGQSLFADTLKSGKRDDSITKYPLSVNILNKIDYDFSYFDKNTSGQFIVAVRTKILDQQVSGYSDEHSNVVIINFGAGLATRFHRIKSENLKAGLASSMLNYAVRLKILNSSVLLTAICLNVYRTLYEKWGKNKKAETWWVLHHTKQDYTQLEHLEKQVKVTEYMASHQ